MGSTGTQVAGRRNESPDPHDLEAELTVLGAMTLARWAADSAGEILDPEDFYRPSHGTIFTVMREMLVAGKPLEPAVIADELDKRDLLEQVGGKATLHAIAASVTAAGNVTHYARIVKDLSTLRQLISAGLEIQQLGEDRPGEIQDLVDAATQKVFDLSLRRASKDFVPIGDSVKDSVERIVHLHDTNEEVTGTPTGFNLLDKLTAGFQPGNLLILAARPSMGKSAMALCAATHIAVKKQVPVALFTMEMSKTEVTQRMLCSEAKIDSQKVMHGRLATEDWPRFLAVCDKLIDAPIYVDDSGSISITEIRSKARRLKTKEPKLGLVIVDYLQLMGSGSIDKRVQEISQISRQLKLLARDIETPVLALSQLSRLVEHRHDKRPILSDLRDSGAIEQDADLVMFIYRDEYYNGEESDQQGIAELILAKNRNGPTGLVKLSFVKRFAMFADMIE